MNRLENEKSPYLLHHANNPVDWFAWGDEAFAKAQKENKPIILSIGYSTCHWCHVMERESFENKEIAALMNSHFISIKVDREERPDLDQIYMASVTAMTGQGGWPLTVFLTPEKKPFFGGTYFPPYARWGSAGFSDILESVRHSWQTNKDQVIASSVELTVLLERRFSMKTDKSVLSEIQLDQMFNRLKSQFDTVYGGFSQSPKFPMGHTLSILLRYWRRTNKKEALNMVTQTLRAMAQGGMYDQLGGGFHRYSTDQFWHVPHFEKMLYDQALLVRSYLEAFQITGERFYADVARDVLEYVLRDMTDERGGFFCAEDADSLDVLEGHDKEGAFYVWSLAEIQNVLPQEAHAVVAFHFGIEKEGNAVNDPHAEFTGKNILAIAHSIEDTAKHFHLNEDETFQIIAEAKQKLLQTRNQRSRPHLDDKIMADWNGLMISAFAFASLVLDDARYCDAARRSVDFILDSLLDQNGRLLHRYRDGQSGILGTLEDYAFFILGLLDTYEATLDPKYFRSARALTDRMIELFEDQENGGFYLSGIDAEKLIVRSKEIYDGALPSGNSAALLVLAHMYHMTTVELYNEKLQKAFNAFAGSIALHPEAYSFFLSAFDFDLGPVEEIVLCGPHADPQFKEMKRLVYRSFRPNKIFAGTPNRNEDADEISSLIPILAGRIQNDGNIVAAYLCRGRTCRQPVHTALELSEILHEQQPSLKAGQ